MIELVSVGVHIVHSIFEKTRIQGDIFTFASIVSELCKHSLSTQRAECCVSLSLSYQLIHVFASCDVNVLGHGEAQLQE